jgi:hypothetical protein
MGAKPYLFLQNTDWSGWTKADSERFMKWCLFWGMYPGFFSPDASSRHYFSSPERYNRDRELFKRYVPVIKEISRAGWATVTLARSNADDVLVERWGAPAGGSFYLTVFNTGREPREVELRLEGPAAGAKRAVELLSQEPVRLTARGEQTALVLTIPAQDVAVVRLAIE